MKKIVYLNENDLFRMAKRILKEEEMKEGIFDGISNVYQGLKGVWRGEGYDFFRYMNQLKNTVGDLKKHSASIEKLKNLKDKIIASKVPPDKKAELIQEIDRLIVSFEKYSQELNNVEQNVNNRLAGSSSYQPYMKKDEKNRKVGDPNELKKILSQKTKDELGMYDYESEDMNNLQNTIGQKTKSNVSIKIDGKNVNIDNKDKNRSQTDTENDPGNRKAAKDLRIGGDTQRPVTEKKYRR